MPTITSPHDLGERDRAILKQVILCYILSAEPVSSRTVSRRGDLNLSAATIRNVMADLEDIGYLAQPHTSAGRVPTREGYHFFIQSLMDTQGLTGRERRFIDENLKAAPNDLRELLAATVYVLKDLSHQVSVVVTPPAEETTLRSVELVPLSGNKVLCVVVSASGFVDNKVIEVHASATREDLTWVSNYLTENFAGLALSEIRERLLGMMAEERAQVDRLLQLSIDTARQGFGGEPEQEMFYDGTTEVLAHPELEDIHRVRQLFDTFSRKARLIGILNQVIGGAGVRVLIGEDSEVTSELDFSLVTTPYRVGDRRLGTLGIFGPSRMEYQRLIPLVSYLGQALSKILTETFADEIEE